MTDTNTFYYSPSTKGFYESLYHNDIPEDKILISEATRDSLLEQHYAGKEITLSNTGVPVATNPVLSASAIKQQQLQAIDEHFKLQAAAGFTTSFGIKLDTDITDILKLKGIYDFAVLAHLDAIPLLTDYDNVSHTNVSISDLLTMILELSVHYQNIFTTKQNAKAQVG